MFSLKSFWLLLFERPGCLWIEKVDKFGSADAPRNVSITLQSEDHQAVVMNWLFVRAWPVGIRFSNLKGKGKAVLVERLELAFDRMDIDFE